MANDKNINSRSNVAPSIVSNKGRTRFDLGGTFRFTCKTGDYVPFYCKEVLPNDTWDIQSVTLTRLETSLHQTMDNAYLELAFFYVPNRIVMTDWDKLLGANDDPWARTLEISTPQLKLTGLQEPEVVPQSLLNFLMLPSGSYPDATDYLDPAVAEFYSVTQLPLRAAFQIYNDWFRDENIDSVVYFSKGNTDIDLSTTFTFNSDSFSPATDTLKVNRVRDRYSSALPAPQKGDAIGFSVGGYAPVIGASSVHATTTPYIFHATGAQAGSDVTPTDADHYLNLVGKYRAASSSFDMGVRSYQESANNDVYTIDKSNLVADLSKATAITVNDLRLAIAAQVLSEQDARGGTRLPEILFTQWDIKAPSLMMDRSEYLGGRRIPIQMLEVLQTSQTTDTAVLGEDAGHSKTFDANSGSFLKSFMFHGYIIGVAFIRTARSYSQGIDRQFFRKSKYSYFNRIFDNIGEVPVKKGELNAVSFTNDDFDDANDVFGYQEAWYEYKEGLNRDSGYFQAGISGTLDSWHYGDDYDDAPLLSQNWLKEDAGRVDRTIAVKSSTSGFQWSCFFNIEAYATRFMNKYSIPNTFGFGSK